VTPERSVGALVVDAAGGVGWWSTRVPAVAAVSVEIAAGVVVEVDIAWPDKVLAWTVDPGASPASLAAAFADPDFADLVDELRSGGESVSTYEPRTLSREWTRRALVAAVSRWTLHPIDGGALLINTAVAEHGIGNAAGATRLLRFAEYSLTDLAGNYGRELSSAATSSVLEAATLARLLGAVADADELVEELTDRAAVDDASLLAVLRAWRDAAAGQFDGSSVHDEAPPEVNTEYGSVDIATVPPRIIAWNGADEFELLLKRTADGMVLSAALAAGVDPLCKEVNELLAFLAVRGTTELVAVVPAAVDGNSIVARFPAVDAELFDLTFGLFSADIDLEDLRRDEVGAALVDIDRLMVDAWNNDREAVVALASVGQGSGEDALQTARREYEARLTAAETARLNAESALRQLLDTQVRGSAVAALLRKRLAAVADYGADLVDPARQYVEPGLAELVPPDDLWE
jgi:hypothetical protein